MPSLNEVLAKRAAREKRAQYSYGMGMGMMPGYGGYGMNPLNQLAMGQYGGYGGMGYGGYPMGMMGMVPPIGGFGLTGAGAYGMGPPGYGGSLGPYGNYGMHGMATDEEGIAAEMRAQEEQANQNYILMNWSPAQHQRIINTIRTYYNQRLNKVRALNQQYKTNNPQASGVLPGPPPAPAYRPPLPYPGGFGGFGGQPQYGQSQYGMAPGVGGFGGYGDPYAGQYGTGPSGVTSNEPYLTQLRNREEQVRREKIEAANKLNTAAEGPVSAADLDAAYEKLRQAGQQTTMLGSTINVPDPRVPGATRPVATNRSLGGAMTGMWKALNPFFSGPSAPDKPFYDEMENYLSMVNRHQKWKEQQQALNTRPYDEELATLAKQRGEAEAAAETQRKALAAQNTKNIDLQQRIQEGWLKQHYPELAAPGAAPVAPATTSGAPTAPRPPAPPKSEPTRPAPHPGTPPTTPPVHPPTAVAGGGLAPSGASCSPDDTLDYLASAAARVKQAGPWTRHALLAASAPVAGGIIGAGVGGATAPDEYTLEGAARGGSSGLAGGIGAGAGYLGGVGIGQLLSMLRGKGVGGKGIGRLLYPAIGGGIGALTGGLLGAGLTHKNLETRPWMTGKVPWMEQLTTASRANVPAPPFGPNAVGTPPLFTGSPPGAESPYATIGSILPSVKMGTAKIANILFGPSDEEMAERKAEGLRRGAGQGLAFGAASGAGTGALAALMATMRHNKLHPHAKLPHGKNVGLGATIGGLLSGTVGAGLGAYSGYDEERNKLNAERGFFTRMRGKTAGTAHYRMTMPQRKRRKPKPTPELESMDALMADLSSDKNAMDRIIEQAGRIARGEV
jgi:hypothetical protein